MDGRTAWKTGGASQTLPRTSVITLRQHLKGTQLDSIQSVPFHISGVRDRDIIGAAEGKASIGALVTKALFV